MAAQKRANATAKIRSTTRLKIEAGSFPPSVQVTQFTPTQWEQFIEVCCVLRTEPKGKRTYVRVQRLGGAGDAGRDVEARLVPELLSDQWDLYQAKHYRAALTPTDFFPELAKFLEHVAAKTYPRPRKYYICAPSNCGADLHDLVANPAEFKTEFLADWAAGRRGLKANKLTTSLRAEVASFDFKRIEELLLRDLLTIHASDPTKHFKLFHITPERGSDPQVPSSPTRDEQRYIAELVRVYSEKEGRPVTVAEVLASAFADHFEACRMEFYCAEGLKRFSRDLFPDEFERLLGMVHDGIRSAVYSPRHDNGLARLEAAIKQVGGLTLTDSKLHARLRGGDLNGTCHHLVNEKRLHWLK